MIKIIFGLFALLLWCLLIKVCLSFFKSFALGASLGPMQSEWLLVPSFLMLLAFGLLAIVYYLLIQNSQKLIRASFVIILFIPHILLTSYFLYVSTLIILEPYFTSTVTQPINLRLEIDELNRPVFFFTEYHIKNGFHYDPYRKHILKYPEAVFKLSEQKNNVTGIIVVEYSYNQVKRFWLTHIEGYPIQTNRIDGSFIPDKFLKRCTIRMAIKHLNLSTKAQN